MRSPMRPLLLTLAFAAATLSGCATPPPANDPDAVAEYKENNDPLEPLNRVLFNVNNAVDVVVLRPIALGYHYGVPQPIQNGVRNTLSNLGSPVTFANDVMQGKPQQAANTTARLLINSTIGLGGIFDVASDLGVPAHDNDFGLTLAVWGLPSGMYLYLPVIGPSNPRDAVGFGVDTVMDPFNWIGQGDVVQALRWVRLAVTAVQARGGVLEELDKVMSQALDPYATIRSGWQQRRKKQVEDARAGDAPSPRAVNKTP